MKDFDYYYYVLGLLPGASLEAIQRAWRIKAQLHPDIFAAGPLREEAERKLVEANVARDVLRKWWQEHNCAPPTTNRGFGRTHAARRAQAPPPTHRPAEPEQRRSPRPVRPFGPPPFRKTAQHHAYDFCMRADSLAAGLVFWPTAFVLSLLPACVIALVFAVVTGVSLFAVGGGVYYAALCGLSCITVMRAFAHDFGLYQIQETPFVEGIGMTAAAALKRIKGTLEDFRFQGQQWQTGDAVYDPAEQLHTLVSTLALTSAIYKIFPASYKLTLTVKVCAAEEPADCVVAYWFDVEAPPLWKYPADSIAAKTDEALRSSLKADFAQ